ncbi:MAG TPA: ribulose-phosphate 3-epimerase [Candidatus Acidoferrales bacterium]|nr:ribulose-phosphate 3-epimerase [Candidatus Acidoferrales bacterium]
MHPQIDIAPSILAANFARLGEEIAKVERAGVRLIHVDVMDGHFVPNISIGVPVVASLRKATRLLLDVHLMIENPEQYVEPFATAGADTLLIHEESTPHLDRVVTQVREHGCRAGVVINPATPVAALDDILYKVDQVLVMSVNPGFGGQSFLPRALEKIRDLRDRRARHGYTYRIEVDGGVVAENTAELVRAGAEILVAGTSIFRTPDPAEAARQLLQIAMEAMAEKV